MINFARWFFFGILIYAPWAYGCTTTWTIDLANYLVWSCGGICLMGWLWERYRPRLPVAPLLCLVLIVFQGFWMWFNAVAEYDTSYWQFIFLSPPFPDFPGSWNKAATLHAFQGLVSLTIAFLITSDLVSDRIWRQRLWTTIGLAAVSMILFGLAQRAFHAPSIFWLKENTGNTFFATYRYHANAGAYLNLTWPILAILTVEAWQGKETYVSRALWLGALLLGLSACFINVSRGASGITLLLVVPAVLAFRTFFREQLVFLPSKIGVVWLVLLSVFIAVLILGGPIYQAQGRWEQIEHQINTDNPRLLVDQATFKMIPLAGYFGFGPGTFSTMFPYFSGYLGNALRGFWVDAHEDYLQTLVEYGYVGTALWSFLFFGGLAKVIRGSFNRHLRTFDRIECRGLSLALGSVALHSLFDFPLQIYSLQLYVITFLAYAWTRSRPGRHKRVKGYREAEDAPESQARKH
jgi:O-antigen ligase